HRREAGHHAGRAGNEHGLPLAVRRNEPLAGQVGDRTRERIFARPQVFLPGHLDQAATSSGFGGSEWHRCDWLDDLQNPALVAAAKTAVTSISNPDKRREVAREPG